MQDGGAMVGEAVGDGVVGAGVVVVATKGVVVADAAAVVVAEP